MHRPAIALGQFRRQTASQRIFEAGRPDTPATVDSPSTSKRKGSPSKPMPARPLTGPAAGDNRKA